MQPQNVFKKYRHLLHHRHLWLPIVIAAVVFGWLFFHTSATTWDPTNLSVAIPSGESVASYASPEIAVARVNALYVRFDEAGTGRTTVTARFHLVRGAWSTWQAVESEDADEEGGDTSTAATRFWAGSVMTPLADAYQFRLDLVGEAGYAVRHFELDARDESATSGWSWMGQFFPSAIAQITGLPVTSRSDWGANPAYLLYQPRRDDTTKDESKPIDGETHSSLRVRTCDDWQKNEPQDFGNDGRKYTTDIDGKSLAWPRTYSTEIKKFIVHHTASVPKDLNGDGKIDGKDYAATVRGIYYSHAVNQGWGDIGYNYLIDPAGTVYEGRSGGEYVIGAHTYCANSQTIGISLIGNFIDGAQPANAQLATLGTLIGELGILYHLDPSGESSWHGRDTSNVVGHRDYGYTTCPGAAEDALADVRTAAAAYITEHRPSDQDFDYKILSSNNPLTIKPLSIGTVSFTIKNVGKKWWPDGTRLVLDPRDVEKNKDALDINRGEVVIARFDRGLANDAEQRVTLPVTAGLKPGRYRFSFIPQFGDYAAPATAIVVNVEQPTLDYEVVAAKHPPRPLPMGETAEAWIELRNTSSFTWSAAGAHRVYLAAVQPTFRVSAFTGSSEMGHLLADTPPGGVGHFVMSVTAPSRALRYIEAFTPAVDGFGLLPDYGMRFDILVREPRFSADVAARSTGADLRFLPGETRDLFVTLKNTSQLAWTPDNFSLVIVKNRGNLTVDLASAHLTADVKKFETIKLPIRVTAPMRGGKLALSVRPAWRRGEAQLIAPIEFAVDVSDVTLGAALQNQPAKLSLAVGATTSLTIAYQNTGTVVWRQTGMSAVKLGTYAPADRASLLRDTSWPSASRAAILNETEVKPNEIGHFTFMIKKNQSGRQNESFAPVMDGVGWMAREPVVLVVLAERTTVGARDEGRETRFETNAYQPVVAASVRPSTTSQVISQTVNSTIRIRLSFTSDRVDIGGGRFTLTDGAGASLFVGDFASIGSEKTGEVYRFVPDAGVILTIANWRHTPAWSKTVNDNRYRGVIEVRKIDSKLVVINELPLEDYVRGIAEPLPTDPTEKVKLLAILARSYAMYYTDPAHRKFPGKPYDGSDNPAEFQKYLGYAYELRGNMPTAAETTRGLVVTYGGRVMKTPYFTSSNGRTKTAAEARWVVADFPFTRSVEDPWSCGGTSTDIGRKLSCPDKARGHGVGISGAGMTGLANEGKSYTDILNYFYDGVKVEMLK